MFNPLLNDEFLNKLFTYTEREIFARIILLSFDETHCLEEIQGRVTGGTINISGTSAVRRTCNLSLVTTDMDINAFHWGLHTKFSLSIGLKNFIDTENFPEIIWFPAGVYVITGLSTSQVLNDFTMSIQGQDKMCLLNGSIGGTIGQTVNFGQFVYDDIELNKEVRVDRLLKRIIFDLVHTYGLEPIQNILINDVDNNGIELLEYRGDTPLYLFKKYWDGLSSQGNYYENMSTDGSQIVYAIDEDSEGNEVEREVKLEDFIKYYTFDTLNDKEINIPTKVYLLNKDMVQHGKERDKYTIARIQYGETAGYRPTDLVYPNDFICNPGESVTAQLDKIVKVLGDYEYYYDVYGTFIFQKKQTFINTPWNGTGSSNNETYFKQTGYESCYKFSFDNGTLITSFNNSPNIANMKNDYFVHGIRKGVGGGEIPIHMRYAIAKKPTEYTTIAVNAEEAKKYGNNKSQDHHTYTDEDWDWREIIYQMAHDFYQYGTMDDFFARVRQANRIYPEDKDLFPFGSTGYEMFYTDLMSYWRELYDPYAEVTYESMISPLTKTPIRVIDDLTRPIYAPIVDENGMMSYDYLEVKIPQDEFDDRKILGIYYEGLAFDQYKNEKIAEYWKSDNSEGNWYQWSMTHPIDFGTKYYIKTEDGNFSELYFSYVRDYQQVGNCYKDKKHYCQSTGFVHLLPYKPMWPNAVKITPEIIDRATSLEPEVGYESRRINCADEKYSTYEVQTELDNKVKKKILSMQEAAFNLEQRSHQLEIYNTFRKSAKEIWNNFVQTYWCRPFSIEVSEAFGFFDDNYDSDWSEGNKLGYIEKIKYLYPNEPNKLVEITNSNMFALCLQYDNVYVQRTNMYFTNLDYIDVDEEEEKTNDITLTNLASDPSFENKSFTLEDSSIMYNTDLSLSGNISLTTKNEQTYQDFFFPPSKNVISIPNVENHIFYIACHSPNFASSVKITQLINGIYYNYGSTNINYNINNAWYGRHLKKGWYRHSKLITGSANHVTKFCFGIGVDTPSIICIDDIILIDLTESFGKGKEPTREWCDANIPFFESEYTFHKINKQVKIASTHKYYIAAHSYASATIFRILQGLYANVISDHSKGWFPQFKESEDQFRYANIFTLKDYDALKFIITTLSENIDGANSLVAPFVMIDLTRKYGAGQEPDLDWCNQNIPFDENIYIFADAEEEEELEPLYYYALNGTYNTEYTEYIDGQEVHFSNTYGFFTPENDNPGISLIVDDSNLFNAKKTHNCYIYQDVNIDDKFLRLTEDSIYDSKKIYYEKTDHYIDGYHQTFSEYTDIYEYDAALKEYLAVMSKGANGLYSFRKDKVISPYYRYPEVNHTNPKDDEVWGREDIIFCKITKGYYLKESTVTLSGYEIVPTEYSVYKVIETAEDYAAQQALKNVFVQDGIEDIVIYEPKKNRSYYTKTCQYYKPIDGVDKSLYYWNKNVVNAPEVLNYWLDFLDGDDLEKYSINIVGDRPKAINDDKVTAIYYRETPTVIFLTNKNQYDELKAQGEIRDGYSYIYLNAEYENMFSISAQGKDAHSVIDNMVYNYSYCVESVTVNAIPIYTLEPNTQISIYDETSKINGLYNIQTLTIPLTHNGLMNIKATKVVDRIY